MGVFTYGLNPPEPGFQWTTHDFGLELAPASAAQLLFRTYGREGHRLHFGTETEAAHACTLRDGLQAVALANPSGQARTFHFFPPSGSLPASSLDLLLNGRHRVQVPLSPAPGSLPVWRGSFDAGPFLENGGESLDLEWRRGEGGFDSLQSHHWRGMGSGKFPDRANIIRVAGDRDARSFAWEGASWCVKLGRLCVQWTGQPLGSQPFLDWGCGVHPPRMEPLLRGRGPGSRLCRPANPRHPAAEGGSRLLRNPLTPEGFPP